VNIAAAVSLLTTATGVVLGVIWWRASSAPGWRAMRWFALVAITAGAYSGVDAFTVFELPPAYTRWATQAAFTIASLHAFAWIRWLAESVPRPLDRFDRFMLWSALGWAAAGVVPGVLVSDQMTSFYVAAIGVTYRFCVPTTLGVVGYMFFLSSLWVVAGRSLAHWHLGWRARMPALAVGILTLLAVNDVLVTARVLRTPILVDFGFLLVLLLFGIDSMRRFAADSERLELLTHRLEQAVAERTRQLEVAHLELARERTEAAVGRLAGGVAHQINSPATVLRVNLGLMREELGEHGWLNDATSDMLDESREALHRIVGIVADLRLSTGTVEAPDTVRHSALLRACIEMAVERARRRAGRDVRVHLRVGAELQVYGESDLVAQMLTELVANAAEAAVAARPEQASVHVVAVPHPDCVDVEIRDNGAGVSPAVRDALIERSAGDPVPAQQYGLGLSVARGLARHLGAALQLVETSASGTTFRVRLRALPHPRADASIATSR